MLKIISERHKVEDVIYQREFESKELPGSGFSFDCDKEGKLKIEYKEALDNFNYCITHPEEFYDKGLVEHINSYIEPAHAICECGREILLEINYLGVCECPNCRTWHNPFGQQLRNPSEWEETY
ncbi:MAG: hypothetical protein RR128_08750 [Clostridium sp.]